MRHFYGSVTHHQNIRFNAQSKLEEPLPQPSWVMDHILLSKMLKAFPPDLCNSVASKKHNYNWRAGMDGLMQNHLNKTIIITNDRKPGVASTAMEKRTSHRKRPWEQLQKVNFFIETRDRKEPSDPSPTPRSSSLLQPTSKHLLQVFAQKWPSRWSSGIIPAGHWSWWDWYFNIACILQE